MAEEKELYDMEISKNHLGSKKMEVNGKVFLLGDDDEKSPTYNKHRMKLTPRQAAAFRDKGFSLRKVPQKPIEPLVSKSKQQPKEEKSQ